MTFGLNIPYCFPPYTSFNVFRHSVNPIFKRNILCKPHICNDSIQEIYGLNNIRINVKHEDFT